MRPVSNPPNPWSQRHVEYDPAWLAEAPPVPAKVYEEDAKSIVAANDSPDVGFRFSVNPYRGCQHACAYCYARPTHQHLGFGAGTDFERVLVVKRNAPDLLRRELSRPSWRGETLMFSGVTDCYQPLEASYRLTRRCLEVCLDAANPVGMVTKSALVRRDADLLAALHRVAGVRVYVSAAFLDPEVARALEPGAPSLERRFDAMAHLSAAGVPVGLALAPIVPGLNDRDVPALLARARAAGATSAFSTFLRLPAEVAPVFLERLEATLPGRAAAVRSAILEARGGRLNDARFGHRMQGTGPRADAAADLFRIHARRLGLREGGAPVRPGGEAGGDAGPRVADEGPPRPGFLFRT